MYMFVTLRIMEFVKTKPLLSSVIFTIIMVPLYIGRFLVVNLYSSFSMHLEISPEGQIYNYQF